MHDWCDKRSLSFCSRKAKINFSEKKKKLFMHGRQRCSETKISGCFGCFRDHRILLTLYWETPGVPPAAWLCFLQLACFPSLESSETSWSCLLGQGLRRRVLLQNHQVVCFLLNGFPHKNESNNLQTFGAVCQKWSWRPSVLLVFSALFTGQP